MPQYTDNMLALPRVMDRTGLSRSTIYAMIRDHRFPAPIKVGTRAIRWRTSTIEQWIAQREACTPVTSAQTQR